MNDLLSKNNIKATLRLKVLFLSLLSVLVVLAFILPRQLAAQDFGELGLAVKPAITEVSGLKGETVISEITIENISAKPIAVTVGSRSLQPTDEIIDHNRKEDFDASNWIRPLDPDLLLGRGESQKVRVAVDIPITAGPGGHYALITYRTASAFSETEDSSGTTSNPELTTVLFITIPGLINEEASATLETKPRIVTSKTHELGIELSNTGNIHVLPSVEFVVKNRAGEITSTIRPRPSLTLPNTRKQIRGEWLPEDSIGKHTIDTRISYGSPQQEIVLSTHTVWILPSPSATALISSLLVLMIFTATTFKKWPGALRKLLASPLRFGSNKKKESNRPGDIHKLSAKTDALDAISKDKYVKNLKTRERPKPKKKTAPKPKKLAKKSDDNFLRDEINSKSKRQYIKTLGKKARKKR